MDVVVVRDDFSNPKTMTGWPQRIQEEVEWPHPRIEGLGHIRPHSSQPALLCCCQGLLAAFVVAAVERINHTMLDRTERFLVSPLDPPLEMARVIMDLQIRSDAVLLHHIRHDVDLVI